jgi:hypothetical protein
MLTSTQKSSWEQENRKSGRRTDSMRLKIFHISKIKLYSSQFPQWDAGASIIPRSTSSEDISGSASQKIPRPLWNTKFRFRVHKENVTLTWPVANAQSWLAVRLRPLKLEERKRNALVCNTTTAYYYSNTLALWFDCWGGGDFLNCTSPRPDF